MKRAIVWSVAECSMCVEVETRLEAAGYAVEKRSLRALQAGQDADSAAMAQLAMQDMAAPVVWVEGRGFLYPEEARTF